MRVQDAASGKSRVPGFVRRNARVWLLLAALAYGALMLVGGAWLHKTGRIKRLREEGLKPLLHGLIPSYAPDANGKRAELETIQIHIKPKHFRKLSQKRDEAVQRGILNTSAADYVPCLIQHGQQEIQARIRLKGDLARGHLLDDKWSFRIDLKDDTQTLFGMKRFSVHQPNARCYLFEWVFQRLLQRENLLGVRYEFVNVRVNGLDLGIYALEEHFEKRLIEHQRRREGPIVRFDESWFWESWDTFLQSSMSQDPPYRDTFQPGNFLGTDDLDVSWDVPRYRWMHPGSGQFEAAQADAFDANKWLATPEGARQLRQALYLLEALRAGRLTTSQVFDVESYAAFMALVDLTGGRHTCEFTNHRFYYNPVTSRLEPIGFDAGYPIQIVDVLGIFGAPLIGRGKDRKMPPGYPELPSAVFRDPAFFEAYVRELDRISQPGYVEQAIGEFGIRLNELESILGEEWPGGDFYGTSLIPMYKKNQEVIRKFLNPGRPIHAYLESARPEGVVLRMATIQPMPVEIAVVSGGGVRFKPAGMERVLLPGRLPAELPDYYRVTFKPVDPGAWNPAQPGTLAVTCKIPGGTSQWTVDVFPWPWLPDNFPECDFLRQPSDLKLFPFLKVDEAARTIAIRPGDWTATRSLIIPSGYTVHAGPDTRINLTSGTTIVSFSPLEFLGEEDHPVVLASPDGTGQGLSVIAAQRTSTLDHVVFDGLSNPNQPGWGLTGAVTFYESPVVIRHSRFVNNRCEDGLNIVRTEFTIDNTLFQNTQADAFDSDFCRGKIFDSTFAGCGNDAVDVSGSEIDLRDLTIRGVGDKGLSAGEDSKMNAERVAISQAELAMTSKDLSLLKATDCTIADSRVGFTAYRKKPEFGPGRIEAAGIELKNVEVPHLIEKGSTLVLNGRGTEGTEDHLDARFYGVEYGKASR